MRFGLHCVIVWSGRPGWCVEPMSDSVTGLMSKLTLVLFYMWQSGKRKSRVLQAQYFLDVP